MAVEADSSAGDSRVLAGGLPTVEVMPSMSGDRPTFLHEGAPLSALAYQYFGALRRGERHLASQLVLEVVAAGAPVKDIYMHVFQPAQYEICRLWQLDRINVAKELYCTAATQLVMSQLYPHIFATAKSGRTMVATCVAGYPFSTDPELWREVGADGSASDAQLAVVLANQLMEGSRT